MKPRRSRFEIYMDILEAVAEGNSRPSHIMYNTNLTWKRVKEHLGFLVDQNMVILTQGRRGEAYDISERGLNVLGYFRMIRKSLHMESLVMGGSR